MKWRRWAAAVLVCSAVACGGEREADAREALLAADRDAGPALERVLAEDAYYLGPDLPLVEGRAAIARELRGLHVAERRPLVAGVSADGSHGYTAGRTRAGRRTSPDSAHGKYLAYWRKEPEAGWRLWAIVVNPSPSAPDTAPASLVVTASDTDDDDTRAPTADDLLAADAAFSARAESIGVGPAFGEFAEPSALALVGPGHGMVWGDSAIGAYFGSVIPPSDRLTWTPRIAHLAPSGDLGFTVGDAIYRHQSAAGPAERFYTKYLTVWRRQPDGSWRYAADGGNDQPAPARRSDLRARREAGTLRLSNPDTAAAFYLAFEQRTTALVNWRPCVDPDRCHSVPPQAEKVVPLDSIAGYDRAADSVTIFWWRRSLSGERGLPFDSVRSLTVGVR